MVGNYSNMMKQAQALQENMQKAQAEIAAMQITGEAGGGMVKVTLNGKGDMRAIKIDPKLLDPAEVEVLEDLIRAATKDAKDKVEAHMAAEMSKMTGGLQLPPGMKLPF